MCVPESSLNELKQIKWNYNTKDKSPLVYKGIISYKYMFRTDIPGVDERTVHSCDLIEGWVKMYKWDNAENRGKPGNKFYMPDVDVLDGDFVEPFDERGVVPLKLVKRYFEKGAVILLTSDNKDIIRIEK